MIGGPPPGLGFFLVAMATLALGLVGLPIQVLVVALFRWKRPEGRWRIAASALGPLFAVVVGGAAMAYGEHVHDGDLSRTLDDWGWALPLLSIAGWVAISVVVLRAGRGSDPQSVT